MKKLILAAVLILALGAGVAACGSDDSDNSDSASVEITDAWARTTTPTQDSGAVYMTISSDEGDMLLKAEVPASIAGKTEVHETTLDDEPTMAEDQMESGDAGMEESDDSSMHDSDGMTGESGSTMMGMKEVESIEIPAGESVTLEPGGFHIMLMDLKGQIEAGDTIPVTLTFEKAGTVEVDATAKDE